jgi:hypothetical protein
MSIEVAHDDERGVHDDLCGSDHFPNIIESLHSTVGERPTRYKFDKADWPRYEQMYGNLI